MWPKNVHDWVATIAYVVGAMAAVGSVWRYYRNSAQNRMHWLFELYQRFHGDPELRKMRVRIDWSKTAFALKEQEDNAELLGQLDDYLNFFEFVAYLQERKELKETEIITMFDYPLQRIAKDSSVVQYMRRPENGYEKLPGLLMKLGYPK